MLTLKDHTPKYRHVNANSWSKKRAVVCSAEITIFRETFQKEVGTGYESQYLQAPGGKILFPTALDTIAEEDETGQSILLAEVLCLLKDTSDNFQNIESILQLLANENKVSSDSCEDKAFFGFERKQSSPKENNYSHESDSHESEEETEEEETDEETEERRTKKLKRDDNISVPTATDASVDTSLDTSMDNINYESNSDNYYYCNNWYYYYMDNNNNSNNSYDNNNNNGDYVGKQSVNNSYVIENSDDISKDNNIKNENYYSNNGRITNVGGLPMWDNSDTINIIVTNASSFRATIKDRETKDRMVNEINKHSEAKFMQNNNNNNNNSNKRRRKRSKRRTETTNLKKLN